MLTRSQNYLQYLFSDHLNSEELPDSRDVLHLFQDQVLVSLHFTLRDLTTAQ